MKGFTLFLIFLISVYQSHQSFIFEPKKPEKPVSYSVQSTTSAADRFIVNIVEYSFVNNSKTASKFRCLGTLISQEFVVTTASCVNVPDNVHIGIQFETIKDDTNEIGYSIRFDDTSVWKHDGYKTSDNETNNIALIKFDPQSITTTPPIFSIFKPRVIGNLPAVADHCTIYGRNVHLSNPPKDNVFIIGPSSCYGTGGKQAFCSILDDANADPCKVLQGAPVVCKNEEVAGIVLGDSVKCVKSGSKVQLRYHSVGDFKKFLDYHSVGPTTTPKVNAASTYKSSMSAFIILFVYAIIRM